MITYCTAVQYGEMITYPEHPTLQKEETVEVSCFEVLIALQDPDPDPPEQNQCGSISTALLLSHSGSESDSVSNWAK